MEIKNCPFCDRLPEKYIKDDITEKCVAIGCFNPDCTDEGYYFSYKEDPLLSTEERKAQFNKLLERWNTRYA